MLALQIPFLSFLKLVMSADPDVADGNAADPNPSPIETESNRGEDDVESDRLTETDNQGDAASDASESSKIPATTSEDGATTPVSSTSNKTPESDSPTEVPESKQEQIAPGQQNPTRVTEGTGTTTEKAKQDLGLEKSLGESTSEPTEGLGGVDPTDIAIPAETHQRSTFG